MGPDHRPGWLAWNVPSGVIVMRTIIQEIREHIKGPTARPIMYIHSPETPAEFKFTRILIDKRAPVHFFPASASFNLFKMYAVNTDAPTEPKSIHNDQS